jgi:hypothetical protein
MKVYDQIKDMLCDELEEIAKKKELTSSSLDVLDKGIDILKDIATIKAMEQEYPEEGYSGNRGYSQGYFGRMPYYMYDDGMGMSNQGGSYEGGSYARGRGSNAKRDSMGRYSSEGRSYDYSRDGYSGDTKEELQRIMNSAQNDREREAIRKALDSMR